MDFEYCLSYKSRKKKNGKIVTHFNHRGQGYWEYLTISGLVFDEKNEEIFVANMHSTCQIQVYSLLGKYKRTLNYPKNFELKIFDFDDETLLVYDEKLDFALHTCNRTGMKL